VIINRAEKKPVIAILILALLLRIALFVGANFNDDMEYLFTARSLALGRLNEYPIGSIDSLRLMIVFPMSVIFRFIGINEFSASLYFLLSSLGSVLLTYLAAERMFNRVTAIVAALFYATFPLDIAYSTQLVPSEPLTFFFLLSFYMFLRAEKHNKPKLKHKTAFLLLSGVFLGFAYMCNIRAILFALLFPLLAIFDMIKEKSFVIKRAYIWILLGFIIIFIYESLVFYGAVGNPLWRLKIYHQAEQTVNTNTSLQYYPRILFKIRNVNFLFQEGNFGFFAYATICSFIWLLFKRDEKSYFMIIWLILTLLYLQFGVMTFQLRAIAKWARYLVTLLPFSVIITARALKLLGKRTLSKMFIVCCILFLTASNIYFSIGSVNGYLLNTADFKATYDTLKELPEKKIYTDSGSHGYLMLYFKFKRDIGVIEATKDVNEIKDAYVVINGSLGIVASSEMRARLPTYASDIPKYWSLVKEIKAAHQGFYRTFNPKIYYVK